MPLRKPAWPNRLANRLTVGIGLQLLLVSGSIAALTFNLGRREGLQISERFRQKQSVVELSSNLASKLSHPIWINALNLHWLRADNTRQQNPDALAERFWTQMKVFPVDYINFGDTSGAFVGMERSENGELLLNEDTPRSGRGRLSVYAMGNNGQRGALLETIPGMEEFHTESWYTDTVRAGRASWSAIYAWEDQPEVFSISYNAPVYNNQRQLQGVVGVDMVLSQLSTWLAGVWKGQEGIAMIVEPNGDLVASSNPQDTLQQKGGTVQRANITELRSALAQALSRTYFRKEGTGMAEGVTIQNIQGKPYLLASTPWGKEQGLNWELVTALAANPGTRASEQASLIALLATTAAIGLAGLLTSWQIRNLLKPLRQLEQASSTLSASLADGASIGALHFRSGMGAEAGEELHSLDHALSDLVERYNQATLELKRGQERERLRDAETLALLKDKLHSSLEAAAVAHEINQPLSVLLLTSQLLLEQQRGEPHNAVPAHWSAQLQTIGSEAERVVLTIEKMRALLRNVQTEHQRLNLLEVARSAVLYSQSSGATRGLPVDSSDLETNRSEAWVLGDGVQIQLALVNLLRNAAEALQEHRTAAPWIGVRLLRQSGQWWLEVEDNGPGLPAEARQAEPLHTSKASGSGLGLFVARTTMDNHHGQLELATGNRGGALLRMRFEALPNTGD